jgi:hypothetical protein
MAFAGLAMKVIAKDETRMKITGQVLNRIMFRLCEIQEKKRKDGTAPPLRTRYKNYFLTGSSGFTSLPGM